MNYKKTGLLFFLIVIKTSCFSQDLGLIVSGMNDTETKIIKKTGYSYSTTDLSLAKKEVAILQKKLEKEGYINNKLVLFKKSTDSSYAAKIHLKNKIEFIHIYIDTSFIKKDLVKLFSFSEKTNTLNIPFKNTESFLDNLNKKLASNGYPFLSLKLDNISQLDSKNLAADLIIEKSNNKRSLDKIVINGYKKFPKAYLKRFLKIKPNKKFNLESIKKKTKALNNLSFAKQLKEPEILFTKDSTQLYLYLEKTKSNTFDGFLGFTTNEVSNKIEFNGYLNLVLNNNLNFGESLNFDYKSDESEQKNFDILIKLPYLFNTPIGIEGALNIIKRDSTFSNTKQKLNLLYQVDSNSSFYAGIESTVSSNLRNEDININLADFDSNFYTIGYRFIKRQNEEKLFQIKSLLTTEFGLGKRKTSIQNINQSLININGQHIFGLNEKNSIYIRGKINILNSDNYLENELIRFGGVNSIRGFAENSITATDLYVLNTEYRYKLSNSLFINSILDIGSFKNKLLNQNENLYGFGFGFGVLTKGGLLRFIYANGKNQEQPFNLSNSKIHLSFTSVF